MPKRSFTTIDGNEAAAHVAYRTGEVIAIYPITLLSPIGESADAWSSVGKPNIWGTVPAVVEIRTLERLHEVHAPERIDSEFEMAPPVPAAVPPFVRDVLGEIIAGGGNELPVRALPCDGTYPTGTAGWEKRNLALEIPVWDPGVCIQYGGNLPTTPWTKNKE